MTPKDIWLPKTKTPFWRGLSGTDSGGRFAPGCFCSLPKTVSHVAIPATIYRSVGYWTGVPESALEYVAFWMISGKSFPAIFPRTAFPEGFLALVRNPRTDPGNSHSLLTVVSPRFLLGCTPGTAPKNARETVTAARAFRVKKNPLGNPAPSHSLALFTNSLRGKNSWGINFCANACGACIRTPANTGKYFWWGISRVFCQILKGIHAVRIHAAHPREYRKIFLANYLCIGFVPGGIVSILTIQALLA